MQSFIILFGLIGWITCSIVPTEVMYNPKSGNNFEYVELYNTGSDSVDLSGWSITELAFTFPSGASIAANGYVVIAHTKDKLTRAYSTLNPSIVYGDFTLELSNKEQQLTLLRANGDTVFTFKYKDSWWPLTDGFGSSLELICPTSDITAKNNWRASPLPLTTDRFVEYSGTPGAASTWYSCPSPSNVYAIPSIVFSEIMYSTMDTGRVEFSEFIEIYNNGTSTISLDRWRLVSDSTLTTCLNFEFPTGVTIAPQAYLVIAKNRNILQTANSGLTNIVGDYLGELKNGGDHIALVDSNGIIVDEIDFADSFPWPSGADKSGLSLQRISYGYDSSKKYNWMAATPTPGQANPSAKAMPDPVATDLAVVQRRNDTHGLYTGETTTIIVKIGPKNYATAVSVEWFVDDISITTETTTTSALTKGADDQWSYDFASFAANTIVRYRVRASWPGSDNVIIFPRSNDLNQWEAFFIANRPSSTTPIYELFITIPNWSSLWTSIENGLYLDAANGTCCNINPTWNNDVPAVFAYQGKAYDVYAKYQGSGYNRLAGFGTLRNWVGGRPTKPDPLTQLSWKIKLPRGVSIEGRDDITLLKPRVHGQSYVSAYVMYKLGAQLGIPSANVRFVRFNINGEYYSYMMDVNYYSDDLIKTFNEDVYGKYCDHQASEQVGFMFKAHGYGCEGPIGPASEQYLWPITCGARTYSALERTQLSFDLETQKSWGNHEGILNFTSQLLGPNQITIAEGDANLRAWFYQNFDVNYMLSYVSLMGWVGSWDDLLGNHMIYQRVTDGKWTMALWDMDSFFGYELPCLNASCSVYLGEIGAPVGRWQSPGGHNVLKNAFIKAFRPEFNARIMLLSRTVLSPANFNALLSECNATLNQAELNEASGNGAFYPDIYQKMGDWNQARWNYVTSTYASSATSDNLNVCPSKPATTTTTTAASFIRAPGTPNTPSNPASTSSSITIGWETPNSNGNAISSFTVQRRSVSGDWTTIYTGLDRSFEDTGLTTGDSLTYRVKATNSQGDSAWSNEATYVVGTASTTGDVNVGTPTTGDNVINNESSSAIGVSVSLTLSFFICLFF